MKFLCVAEYFLASSTIFVTLYILLKGTRKWDDNNNSFAPTKNRVLIFLTPGVVVVLDNTSTLLILGFYIYGHLRSHSSKWSQDKQLIKII
jgi:hypothetical protein